MSVDMTRISLLELKAWVRRRLPPSDPVRVAIEAQPERVSAEELVVLFKAWDLMVATR
jgi:hypothetical protein